jgi:hypothetical protein
MSRYTIKKRSIIDKEGNPWVLAITTTLTRSQAEEQMDYLKKKAPALQYKIVRLESEN